MGTTELCGEGSFSPSAHRALYLGAEKPQPILAGPQHIR